MDGSHDRDQSVERLLRQSFKTPPAGMTDSCLDAETIATWADGGLSGARLAIVESHVADCARCQSIVRAVVRTTAAVPQPEPARHRWLAWLVPLTAAGAAVALWVAVPRGPGAPRSPATDISRQAAEVRPSEPTALDDQLQAPANAKEEQGREAKKDLVPTNQVQVPELRKDAERREADQLKPAAATGAIASPVSPDQTSAAPAAAPPSAFAAREATQAKSAVGFAEAAEIVIVSPDPSVRWRLAGSVVERSTNGGSSWDAVFTGAGIALVSGAAPSPSACWVVGRAGVVLLSTDGRSFSRLAFPETTDLSAVRATDARTASVTTLDGRIFNTTDGGATWERR